MSVSKEKNITSKGVKAHERLLQIGKDFLAGHTNAAKAELTSMKSVEFTDVFYLLDKLGSDLTRREQRLLLDLVTEIIILNQLDVELDQHIVRARIKRQIRDTGEFGKFIFQIIEQINDLHNT